MEHSRRSSHWVLMKAGRRLLFPGWHLLPRPDASSQLPADMSTNVGDSPHPTRTGRRSHLQGVGEGVPHPILASVSLLLVGNLEAPSLDHMVAWRERLGTPTGRGKWRGLRDPKSWSWRSGALTMVLDSTPPPGPSNSLWPAPPSLCCEDGGWRGDWGLHTRGCALVCFACGSHTFELLPHQTPK